MLYTLSYLGSFAEVIDYYTKANFRVSHSSYRASDMMRELPEVSCYPHAFQSSLLSLQCEISIIDAGEMVKTMGI